MFTNSSRRKPSTEAAISHGLLSERREHSPAPQPVERAAGRVLVAMVTGLKGL